MRAKQYRHTIQDIADISGRSIYAVRSDISRGKLDPCNLMDVARYLHDWTSGFHEHRPR